MTANSLKNGAPGWSRSTPSIAVSRSAVYAAFDAHCLTELGQSGRSQPAEVDRGGDGHQRLVRADVGVGLLATDVLFARLEREHVADLAVDVDRLAADPPGHLADVVQASRDETEVRTAVVQVVPQRLSLGDRDVGTELAGRRQDAEGERVEHLDRARSPVVGPPEQIAHRLEDPVDVRVLHDHGRHVGSDVGGASASVRHREDLRLVPRSPAVRAERVHEPRIDGAGDEHPVATVAAGHVHGLDQRGRSVVQGCVRDLEPGQLADHRLELEQRLQHALRQLRLVRRVRRVELGPTGQRPDDAGDVVVVRASTGEAHQLVGAQVASRERAHVVHELHLGDAGGDVERPVEAHVGRDVGEQLVHARQAERREHLVDVVLGVWREPHERKVYVRRRLCPAISRTHLRGRTSSRGTGSRADRRPCTGSRGSARGDAGPCGSSS